MATKSRKPKRASRLPQKKYSSRPVVRMTSLEVAAVFRNLAAASGKVFTDNTSFLITENSAHILLTRTFTMLANATLAGQLKFTASRIVKNAEAQRAQVLPELKQLDGHRQSLPVMGEDDGNKFARAVQNCVNPKVPDALKTNY